MAKERIARLEARLPKRIYETIKLGAQLRGRSVSDFVVDTAHEAAQRAIKDEGIVRLALEGQRAFAEAIAKPGKPTAGLKRAVSAHRRLIREVR